MQATITFFISEAQVARIKAPAAEPAGMDDERDADRRDAAGADGPEAARADSADRAPAAEIGRGAQSDAGAASAKRPVGGDRTRGSPLDLRLALAEHRPHILAAAAVFAVGLLGGIAVVAAGFDMVGFFQGFLPEDVELSWWFVFQNNVTVLLVPIVGVGLLTLGVVTVLILAFNGVVVGGVVAQVASDAGVGLVLALIVPHGVFELPAFWIGGGVTFRVVHLLAKRVRGTRERFLTGPEVGRALLLVGLAVVMLAIAAAIEVYVTPAIAETLFGISEPETV